MLVSHRRTTRFTLLSLFLASLSVSITAQVGNQADKAAKAEGSESLQFQLLAKGVAASPAVTLQFKSAPLRLEIRNLVMGKGETEPVPVPTRILFELRQGAVTTSLNQQKQERHQGDFWVVEKNASFTIENSSEVAVLRAIYIFEGSR